MDNAKKKALVLVIIAAGPEKAVPMSTAKDTGGPGRYNSPEYRSNFDSIFPSAPNKYAN